MPDVSFPVLVFVVIVVFYLISSIKILREYERGVIFRLGRALPAPKGPGIILVFRPFDQIVRVSLRQQVFVVQPQDVITRDNVTLKVDAVVTLYVVNKPCSWRRLRYARCWERPNLTKYSATATSLISGFKPSSTSAPSLLASR
jgi:regulator of protease activity HflC (stomatin/prohibitin superfamily)